MPGVASGSIPKVERVQWSDRQFPENWARGGRFLSVWKGRKRLRRQARSAECSVCFGISALPSRILCASLPKALCWSSRLWRASAHRITQTPERGELVSSNGSREVWRLPLSVKEFAFTLFPDAYGIVLHVYLKRHPVIQPLRGLGIFLPVFLSLSFEQIVLTAVGVGSMRFQCFQGSFDDHRSCKKVFCRWIPLITIHHMIYIFMWIVVEVVLKVLRVYPFLRREIFRND